MTACLRSALMGVAAVMMLSACRGAKQPEPLNLPTPSSPGSTLPTLSIGPASALESSLLLSMPVTLSAASSQDVLVNIGSRDGTAMAGSDYTALNRTLTIPAGQTRVLALIDLGNDDTPEGTETLSVTLSNPSNAQLGMATATGTIQDDDSPITLSIASVQRSEGQIGESPSLQFRASLSRSSSAVVSAAFATVDDTATAGSDYTASSGHISFAPGQTEQLIAVNLLPDETVEPDETMVVQLSDALGATLELARGSGTLVNDDSARSFSVDDAAASENAGPLTFTVRLSQASGKARTVRFETVAGTAVPGSDYSSNSGTLSLAAGQSSATVNVALLDDAIFEPTETLSLRLTAEGDTAVADGEGSGTILDNDTSGGGGGEPPPPAANMDQLVLQDIPTFNRCDFLNREYCLFPWPNDWFTTADAASATGRRVNMNLLSMPKNSAGKPLDPTEWNRSDGFSPGQLILARIPGLDLKKTGGVPLTNLGDSTREDQPILVLDLGPAKSVNPTAIPERHLIWAEMDANLSKFTSCDSVKPAEAGLGLAGDGGVPGAEQFAAAATALREQCAANPTPEDPTVDPGPSLTIRPAVNFTPGHRYAVVLRNLKNTAGTTLQAPASFRIYRDRAPTMLPMVEARRAHFEELFSALSRAGVERSELYLTWDFTVISDQNLTGRLVHIRDDALAKLGDSTPGDGVPQGTAPVISNVTVSNNTGTGNTAREVRGVITVPSYMDRPFGNAGSKFYYAPSAAGINGDNLPDVNPTTATQQFDFLCRIPRRAFGGAEDPATATAGVPQRPSLYGHGLLGSKSEGGGQIGAIVQEVGMIYCATDWIGMASHDFDPADGPIDPVYRDPPFGDIANVATLLTDMSNFASLTDRLQQSFVNFTYLGRAILNPDGFCAQAAFKVGDQCLIDRTALYYDGNSQGGIFGGSLTAMSPDIKAATLGVPGMNYSTLLQRSVDFDQYAAFFYASYRASLDQQFVLSFIQMLWDRSDTNGYAHRLRPGNPLPNTPEKRTMLHPAFGDHQVSMTTAEVMARTMGAELKCPAVVGGSSAQRGPAVLPGVHPAVSKEAQLFPLISFNRRHHDDEPYFAIPCISSYPHKGNALVVWDSGPVVKEDGSPRNDNNGGASGVATPPLDNRPPRPEEGYGGDPHEFPRSTAESRQMKDAFYRPDGGVTDTCGGKPCVTRGFNPAP
ncbi:MAG: Calx-beta domain-containing protein [Pseudomonadota bacterium]